MAARAVRLRLQLRGVRTRASAEDEWKAQAPQLIDFYERRHDRDGLYTGFPRVMGRLHIGVARPFQKYP